MKGHFKMKSDLRAYVISKPSWFLDFSWLSDVWSEMFLSNFVVLTKGKFQSARMIMRSVCSHLCM